jgi:ribose/xylose/arabinose/galactoside ABC-type transport system permease subunit
VRSEIATKPSGELETERDALQRQLAEIQSRLNAMRDLPSPLTSYTPALALVLTLATGCLCGLLNGSLISFLRVVPFIVTLGTMTLYLGIAKLIAQETTVRPDRATQVPDWLSDLLSIRSKALWAGLPLGIWLMIGLALVLAAVLRYTVFSRYVYALGSNEATARLCGINVSANKIAVYTLAGLFVGLAGICQFAYLSVGNPTSGLGLELRIIAAVVIGGASLSGGRGSVVGTLCGVGIMAVIDSGCTQLGLSNPVQDVILGVIIIAAVAVDQLRQRRLDR